MDLIIYILEQLTPYQNLSYYIIFMILIACGFGLPLPEDVVLISGGILSSKGDGGLVYMVMVSMMGVLIGDGIVYFLGKFSGPRIKKTTLFKKMFSDSRESKIQSWFDKYGDKVVFFARFAPGLRMPLFLTSGIYKIPTVKFFLLDGLAAIISVPLWVWLGHMFGNNLDILNDKMNGLQKGIYITLGVLMFVGFVLMVKKKYLKNKKSSVV